MRIQSSLIFSPRHHGAISQLIRTLTYLCQPQITCTGFPMTTLVLTYDVLEFTFLGLVSVQAMTKRVTVHLLHQLKTPWSCLGSHCDLGGEIVSLGRYLPIACMLFRYHLSFSGLNPAVRLSASGSYKKSDTSVVVDLDLQQDNYRAEDSQKAWLRWIG